MGLDRCVDERDESDVGCGNNRETDEERGRGGEYDVMTTMMREGWG